MEQQIRAEVLRGCWWVCHLKSNLLHPQVPDWPSVADLVPCPAEPDLQRASVGSLSAFLWTRFGTALCCFASVEPWLQHGTAVPRCLPGQRFCPSCATTGRQGMRGPWAHISEQLCRLHRAEGEPRGSSQVSISAAAASLLPEALSDISACKLTPLWPFTFPNTLYLYPFLSSLLTPPFLHPCFACPSELGCVKG